VLRELGLIIEFLLEAIVLIPSTIITHHNTKVQQGEMRHSFTQYVAGSLFSYIKNRMRSEWKMMEAPKLMSAENDDHAQARCEH
jgi:hypothetical protein